MLNQVSAHDPPAEAQVNREAYKCFKGAFKSYTDTVVVAVASLLTSEADVGLC